VDAVKVGDPGAVTTQGQQPAETTTGMPGIAGVAPGTPAGGTAGMPAGAGGLGIAGGFFPIDAAGVGPREPDAPPSLAERLLRVGYVKVNSKGLFHADLYASADQISRVADGTVYLTASKDELIKAS
jgi:hypothetical protein